MKSEKAYLVSPEALQEWQRSTLFAMCHHESVTFCAVKAQVRRCPGNLFCFGQYAVRVVQFCMAVGILDGDGSRLPLHGDPPMSFLFGRLLGNADSNSFFLYFQFEYQKPGKSKSTIQHNRTSRGWIFRQGRLMLVQITYAVSFFPGSCPHASGI